MNIAPKEVFNFVDCIIARSIAKGWNDTSAILSFRITSDTVELMNGYIYPKADVDGELVTHSPDIFFGSIVVEKGMVEETASRISSYRENANRDLFSAIELVKRTAERAGVSAEFVNPITALAEQLASNALEDKSNA